MMLGKLSVPDVLLIVIVVGQGPIAFAIGAFGGCCVHFFLSHPFFSFYLPLWGKAR